MSSKIMYSSRKYPYSPHRRDWNFLEVKAFLRPEHLKKCIKLNWNFQRGKGGGGAWKKPLQWGGKDIFRNYTMICRYHLFQIPVAFTRLYLVWVLISNFIIPSGTFAV